MKAQEKNVINNVNFVKMKSKEQLAKEYSNYAMEQVGFIAGFSAKEEIIKESLNTLTQLVEDINNLPLTEQIFKSRDLDRLNNKIEVLKSLL